MLRVSENLDPLLARPFGISSVPSKSSIEIVYRVVGRGTALLTGMEVRSYAEPARSARKRFSDAGQRHDAGSGCRRKRFSSACIFCLSAPARAPTSSSVRQNKECLPPSGIIKNFKDTILKVHIATEDGSTGTRGMSTDILNAFLTKMEQKTHLVLYACGPHAMLAAVSRIAAEHSIPCYVSMEERMACGLGACMGCSIPMKVGRVQAGLQRGAGVRLAGDRVGRADPITNSTPKVRSLALASQS